MKDWLLSLLQESLKQKLPLLFASLIPIQTACFVFLRTYLLPHLADPTGQIALVAITISITLLLAGLATYFYYRPKYKFIHDLGINKNLKTGHYFCSPCYVKNKLESPLKTEPHGWFCNVCRNGWEDPLRPRPPLPPQHDYSSDRI